MKYSFTNPCLLLSSLLCLASSTTLRVSGSLRKIKATNSKSRNKLLKYNNNNNKNSAKEVPRKCKSLGIFKEWHRLIALG